jgi:hypothetical protein
MAMLHKSSASSLSTQRPDRDASGSWGVDQNPHSARIYPQKLAHLEGDSGLLEWPPQGALFA